MTFEEIEKNETIRAYISKADESLVALGYTEHSFAHVTHVAAMAGYLLETLGYDAHTVELAAGVDDVVEVASRQYAVVIFLVIFCDVEIDAAVALIGKAVVYNLLHQLLLLYDVSRGVRLNAWRQHVERLHGVVIAVGVVLCYLHRLELLQTCLLCYLVVAIVGIVFQMAHVGDVSDVAHLIALMLEVAEQDVEGYCRACMTQMRIAIHCRAAHIHAHIGAVDRHKELLTAAQSVIYKKLLFHILLFKIKHVINRMMTQPNNKTTKIRLSVMPRR